MITNEEIISVEKARAIIKDARQKVEEALKYLQDAEPSEWTTRPFHCSACGKDISAGFVMVETWRSMTQFKNDILGESLKVYHPTCWNEREEQEVKE